MTFGTRIRELRKMKRMTQEELGKIAGVSKVSISGYENETRQPDQETLLKFADFFNVSVDFLLGRTEQNKAGSPSAVDLADKNVIMSFEGRPIPPEDIELMCRLLRGSKKDDE